MQLAKLLVSAVAISTAAALPRRKIPQARSVEESTALVGPDGIIGIPSSGKAFATQQDASTTEGLNSRVFAGQCRQMTLGGHGKHGKTALEGQCVDSRGTWWRTSLNLNRCIANRDGVLEYGEQGSFDLTCRPCTIADIEQGGSDDVLLTCDCLDPNGTPRLTKLQMGFQVNNTLAVKPINGRLACGHHQGDVNPVF